MEPIDETLTALVLYLHSYNSKDKAGIVGHQKIKTAQEHRFPEGRTYFQREDKIIDGNLELIWDCFGGVIINVPKTNPKKLINLTVDNLKEDGYTIVKTDQITKANKKFSLNDFGYAAGMLWQEIQEIESHGLRKNNNFRLPGKNYFQIR